jgi:hypothetical protein
MEIPPLCERQKSTLTEAAVPAAVRPSNRQPRPFTFAFRPIAAAAPARDTDPGTVPQTVRLWSVD